MPEVAVDSPPN